MSQQEVAIIRALLPPTDVDLAALFRDDALFEAARSAFAPMIADDVESVTVWSGGTTYTGVDGFRALWLDWLEPWAEYHSVPEDVLDAGARVVVLVRDRGRRHGMDAEVEIIAASVWTIRDGKIARVEFCADRAEALALAGLS